MGAVAVAGRPAASFGDASWPALGTGARVLTTAPDRLGDAVEVVASLLEDVDAAASRFRPDSEVSALADGREHRVSPLLAELVEVALRAARLTGGAVDPTVGGSLVTLGYDRDFAAVPADDPAARLLVRRAPGWRSVRLAGDRLRVPAGTVLDLGATAKAHVADVAASAAAIVAGCGVLVSLGGDVAVAGPPPAAGWRIQLGDDSGAPADPSAPAVRIRSGGLATSSVSVRRWRRGGAALHHLVDPVTGLPAVGPWRTATVAAGSCLDADVAAAATVVLGDAGAPWLAGTGLPARLVDHSGRVVLLGDWPADRPATSAAGSPAGAPAGSVAGSVAGEAGP